MHNGYRLGPVEQIPLGEGRAFALTDGSCSTGDYTIRTYPVWEQDGQIVLELG